MKWIPWARKGARESPDAFTPIVVAGEQESPRARSPREPSVPKRSAFIPISQSSANASTRASSRAASPALTAASSNQNQSRSRLLGLGAFLPWRPSTPSSEREGTWHSEPSRSKASVHPQPELRGPSLAKSSSCSSKAPGTRSVLASDSLSSKAPRRVHSTTRPLSVSPVYPFEAAGRSRSTSRPLFEQHSQWGGRRPWAPRAMSMDAFFDTVSAEMRMDEATLEKSGSEQRGPIATSSSEPPLRRSEDAQNLEKLGEIKTSLTEPKDLRLLSSASKMSRHKALTPLEPGDIKRPMTKAQIFAWKAKRRLHQEGEEGTDMSARPPPPAAAMRLDLDALGDHSEGPAEGAFWSLELNIGSPFGTNQD